MWSSASSSLTRLLRASFRCSIGMEALYELAILGPVQNTGWLRPIRVSRNPGQHRALRRQSREKLGAHSRREFGNRRILKQGTEWQLHPDHRADSGDDLSGQQGMPAECEEIVPNPNPLESQHRR